jgi:L-lactate dehydrogenase complex protein LldG
MTTAREEILGRIRSALTDRPAPPPVTRDYRRGLGAGDVAQFVERVEDYRAVVHRAVEGSVGDVVTEVLGARGIGRVVVPDGFPGRVAASDRHHPRAGVGRRPG